MLHACKTFLRSLLQASAGSAVDYLWKCWRQAVCNFEAIRWKHPFRVFWTTQEMEELFTEAEVVSSAHSLCPAVNMQLVELCALALVSCSCFCLSRPLESILLPVAWSPCCCRLCGFCSDPHSHGDLSHSAHIRCLSQGRLKSNEVSFVMFCKNTTLTSAATSYLHGETCKNNAQNHDLL